MEKVKETHLSENDKRSREVAEGGHIDAEQPIFRIKAVAPYVNEPVVQQNCIR